MDEKERYEKGEALRRRVAGDDFVDRTLETMDDFSAPFQDLATRYAWGEIWSRPGLELKTRSLLVIGMLAALNRGQEFKIHVRSAVTNNGVSKQEIQEVLLQVTVYCGMPAGNTAFRLAREVFAELD